MAEARRRLSLPGRALALALLAGAAAGAGPVPDAPLGLWRTPEGDGVFAIDRCGDALCGRLVGMRYAGPMPLDEAGRPQCGQRLLDGFRPAAEAGRWRGTIRDPSDGQRYDATIGLAGPDVLRLRGYLLLPVFGRTQRWTRYRGTIGAACKLPG